MILIPMVERGIVAWSSGVIPLLDRGVLSSVKRCGNNTPKRRRCDTVQCSVVSKDQYTTVGSQ